MSSRVELLPSGDVIRRLPGGSVQLVRPAVLGRDWEVAMAERQREQVDTDQEMTEAIAALELAVVGIREQADADRVDHGALRGHAGSIQGAISRLRRIQG